MQKDLYNAETAHIPRMRPVELSYRDDPPSARLARAIQEQQTALTASNYSVYYRALVILLVCLLATITALTVIEFWGASQAAQMNQLQQCMSRINPNADTNYQLETYKCMNGS